MSSSMYCERRCFRCCAGPEADSILRLSLMKIRCLLTMILAGFVSASALYAQESTQKDPAAITLPASRLDEYVGQYRVTAEPDVVSAVYREGDRLYVEGERSARAELRAESADNFFVPGSAARAEVVWRAAGRGARPKSKFGGWPPGSGWWGGGGCVR